MIWEEELAVPNPIVDEAIQLVKRLIGSPATGGDGSPATGGEWHRNLVEASVCAKLSIVATGGSGTFDFDEDVNPQTK